MNGLYVTGSDTEVGKTEIAAAITHLLNEQGMRVRVRKPVASGCTYLDGEWVCEDTNALYEANRQVDEKKIITPNAFADPIAPFLAARKVGRPLTIQQLYDACLAQVEKDDILIAEGAGGFYTPLAEDGLCADVAKKMDLKVVVVVLNRLGCINHAILTINAIASEGLTLHSVILNDADDNHKTMLDNSEAIKSYTGIQPYTMPFIKQTRTKWPLVAGHLQNQGWAY